MRQHSKLALSLLAATVTCGLSSQTALAQFSNTSRTGSASGNALTGSSSLGGMSGGGASTSGFGGGAAGGAAGGNMGIGNNAANRTAGNGQSALGQSLFNQGNNQNGFIGGRNQQQQFIGGNQRTGQQTNRQQGNQAGGNRSQFGNQDNFGGMNQQNQSSANQRRTVRPQQKVAFEIPQRSENEIRSTIQTRFDPLNQNTSLKGVKFDLDSEGIVTLSGSVESASAKQLAVNIVRLEPGVKKVVNELTVADKK